MLTQEYGTASNIKSRVNRLSVLAAITSTQQRLKLYSRVPPNGLVLFVGTILTDEGKEKKVSFDFEPHKPINTSVPFRNFKDPSNVHHVTLRQLPLSLRQQIPY
jgi:peptide chain release factor subunit 1